MTDIRTAEDVRGIDRNLTVTGPGTLEIAEDDWNAVCTFALSVLDRRPAAQAAKGVSGDAAAEAVMVPREPTEEMCRAGDETGLLMCGDECCHDHSREARTIYEAMLAAAPSGGHTAASEQEKTS